MRMLLVIALVFVAWAINTPAGGALGPRSRNKNSKQTLSRSSPRFLRENTTIDKLLGLSAAQDETLCKSKAGSKWCGKVEVVEDIDRNFAYDSSFDNPFEGLDTTNSDLTDFLKTITGMDGGGSLSLGEGADSISVHKHLVTSGGPSSNLSCLFPFLAGKTMQTECAKGPTPNGKGKFTDGKKWCATSINADYTVAENAWGYCPENQEGPICATIQMSQEQLKEKQFKLEGLEAGPPIGNKACIFPFDFKGASYNTCTGEGLVIGTWCPVMMGASGAIKGWGVCNNNLCRFENTVGL